MQEFTKFYDYDEYNNYGEIGDVAIKHYDEFEDKKEDECGKVNVYTRVVYVHVHCNGDCKYCRDHCKYCK